MQIQETSNPIYRLGVEILEILLALHFLKTQKYSDSTLENHRETKITALLVNDIVIRLGKFRDDDNRTWNFREVAKYLGKRVESASRSAVAKPFIDTFIQRTKHLAEIRNLAVAHLPKRGSNHLKPLTELRELIGLAVEIVDVLAGEECSYIIETIDLRAAIALA